MDRATADRYLALLDVPRRRPSVAALGELVAAHLARIPFENVSKLARARRGEAPGVPDARRYLADAARHGLGGTCYVLTPHLGELLRALGYEVELHGADMSAPDVHLVNVVRLDGRAYLVDVGYGAPFRAPLPLGDASTRIACGRDAYVLHPVGRDGRARMEHRRDGATIHGYTVTPAARRRAEFDAVVADSYRTDAGFMNCLRVVRHAPGRSVFLRDFRARIVAGGRSREVALPDRPALRAFVRREFGIAPGPLDDAIAWLEGRTDTWA